MVDKDFFLLIENEESQLFLHLDLAARLSVMSGTTILENFFLIDSSKWLKGFWKTSELLISYKCGDKVRVFKQEVGKGSDNLL